MAKEDTQQSVVNPWELDWHNVNVKQDNQSFGRKAKDLGLGIVNTGRNVAGGIAKGVVGVSQAVKGIADFADTVTDGGMAVNPVGLGLKAYDKIAGTDNYQQLVNAQKNARQKAMNVVDNWVDNSDSFAADLARNTGFGKTTQDTKGFGNAIQQNITNYVQSQGMRDSINRRAEQNALEQQRWNALSDDEKGFGARLGHWGNIAGNVISNPLATLDDTVVSATEMVGGGRLLKGANFGLKALQGTKAGAKALGVIGGENAAKAAIVEGLIAGGHNVADTKNELGDEFDKSAALKSGLSGVTTGAIALGGNRLGRALGVADIDEMLVAGAKNTAKGTGGKLGRLGAVAKGAVQEGLLEELPQGMAETALQNWATGKPITDGMAENAISGAIAGGLMGGSGAGVHYQAKPNQGFGFQAAPKVTQREMKKYADSIEQQRQAQAERIYSGSTDLDSEDARINQHISRQVLQGFDLGQGGQRAVDLSAMRQDLTPSNRLGLRRDYQGGGALESTAALAVDSGASFSGSLNNDEIVRSSTQNAQDTISRLGLSAYTQQNKNQSESVSGGLLPQSQLGDDLINTPTDNSVISSRSSSRVVKGATGRKGGSTGATGGNITVSNPPKTTLDGIKSLGIGQGISQNETLSEQPKLGVKGVSASAQNQASVSGSLNNQLSDNSGQVVTNRSQLKTPTQYTAKEQETIRRIESTPNKGRDMAVIGRENFTPNMVDYVVKNNRSVAVDKLSPAKAKELGFKYPDDVRRTIHKGDIEHTLARHGENSDLVKKSGQKPVTKANIANWTKYADRADITVQSKDDDGNDIILSGKQINGYYAVVEQVRKGRNELSFKTMYFQKGNIKDHKEFKKRFEPNSDNVSANHHAGYEPATQLGVGNSNRLKTPVAGSGTPSNSASGQAVASRNPTLSQMPQQGQPVNQTVANTIPQSTEKSSGKQSARLKQNLRQFTTPDNRLAEERQKVLRSPKTMKHAQEMGKQDTIRTGAKSKQKALEIAFIFGWDKTHTPRFDTISDKWVLVKNTYWDSEKSKDEKEDAVVADAVKSVQAATAKISNEPLAISNNKTAKQAIEKQVNTANKQEKATNKQVNQAKTITATPATKPTSQAVASSSVPTTSQTQTQSKEAYYIHTNTQREALRKAEELGVLQTHTPHKDYESGKYILVRNDLIKNPTQTQKRLMEKYKNAAKKAKQPTQTAKNTQNETKNAVVKGSKAKIADKFNPFQASEELLEEVRKALKPDDEMKRRFIAMEMKNRAEIVNEEFATRQDAKERLEFNGWENEFKIVKKGDTYKVVDLVKPYGNLQYGKRQGLEELPDIPVVRLNGNEFDAETLKDMQKLADDFLRVLQASKTPLHNDEQNWDLSISKIDRKKMGDNENLPKHTTQAVAGIRDLAKNAVLVETHEDAKHSNPDVIAIHRLYAPVQIGDTLYRAKLTVKDYSQKDGNQFKNLHAIETVEIEKETAGLGTLPTAKQSVQKSAQPTTLRDMVSISQLLQNAKSDIDGKPLIDEKNQSSVSNKSVSQSKNAKGDKQDEVSGSLKSEKQGISASEKGNIDKLKTQQFIGKKWNGKTIQDAVILPDGAIQLQIGGAWYHENALSYSNFEQINKIALQLNHSDLDILKLKAFRRSYQRNIGDKNSEIYQNASKYNDNHDRKSHKHNRGALENFAQVVARVDTALKEIANSGSLKGNDTATKDKSNMSPTTMSETSDKVSGSLKYKATQKQLATLWDKYAHRQDISNEERQALEEEIIAITNKAAELATKDKYPKVKVPYVVGLNGDFDGKFKIIKSEKQSITKRRLAVRHIAQYQFDIRHQKLIEEHLNVQQLIDDIFTALQQGKINHQSDLIAQVQNAIKSGDYALNKETGSLKQQKSFNPAAVKPATDTQIKQAVVTPKRQASNSEQAKEQANAFLRQELINKHSGLPAVVSGNNLSKMLSGKAKQKSVNHQLHELAIANVDELYKNAIYGWAKPDRDNEPSIKAVHRLFATMRTEQGDFIVKMTVKETTRTEQNNGLYTLEALEIEENTPVASWVEQHISHDNVKGVVSIRSTGAIESLIKNAQEVNNRLPETKQQTQKRLSQQLKDKANAIRESKNSVEHKNAIQQAVINAVGAENAKHIEIVTAAKAQAENDDLRNLSLDFVSQIEGFASADSGKITLIQSAFDSPAVAAFVAWHELGHRGIEIQGRKQWHKSLRAMMNNSPTLRRIAGKKYDLYHNQNGMRDFTAYDALEESIVDLYAAYKTGDFALFEDRNGVTLPNSWKQQGKENAILRMWNAVRAFFSRLFGRKINSDREIFALLRGLDSVQGYDFDPKSGSLKGISNNRYSLSAMKSVKANITRGKKAMNKALTEKTDIHRAMYRNDIGWVDFVYGDKNKGLLHIIHRRMTADKMTKAEVVKMLSVDIIDTIAQGTTIKHTIADKGERLQLQYNGHQATLVKRKGGNAWVLTGFIEYEKLQAMKQVRVATNSALRTTEPILSRQGVGASVNVSNSVSQNAGDNKRFSLSPIQANSKRYPVMQQVKNGQIELPKTVNGLVDWFANAQKTDKNELMARINGGLSVSDEFDKSYLYDKAGNHTLLQKLVNHTAYAGEYHLFVQDENGKEHRIEIDESNPDERLLWDFAKYTTRLHLLPATLKLKQELQQTISKMVDEEVAKDISVLTLAELSDLTPDYEQFANDAGVTFGDKVVIIADRFESANSMDFESTVWHELAHRGIDVQGRDAWHKRLKALAEFSPKLRKLATAKFNQYAQHKTDFTFNEALEEVIADLYGAYKTGNWEFWEIENETISKPFDFTKASEGNFIQRLWRSIKAFFSRVFGRKIDEDREIFALLRGLDGVQGYDFDPKSGSLKSISNEPLAMSNGKRYSLSEKADSDFIQAIDSVAKTRQAKGRFIHLGTTPKTWQLAGIPNVTVSINDNVIRKVMGKWLKLQPTEHNYWHIHNLTPQQLKQLPKHLNSPIAVFKSAKTASKSGYLVLTELTETDAKTGKQKPVVVALHLDTNKKGEVHIVDITTAFGSEDKYLQGYFKQSKDLLKYWDKNKGRKFLTAATGISPAPSYVKTALVSGNVKTNDDLSQAKTRFSLASNNRALAKINQNVVNDLWQHDEFDWLQEDFADNAPTGKMLPKHKKLFDTAKKSKSINEFARVMSDIQAALQNGEIKNSKDILRTYQSLFERTAKFKDLKQYGKEELQAIADNPNFQAWFAKAHKFFKNTDGTPKVFYRGLKIDKGDIGSLKNNASENEYGAEFFTDNAIIASTYSTMIYPHDGFIQQVAINAEKPFIVPHTSGNDWNNLLKDYTVSQVVRLFKMAGFDTKPANWDSLSHRYDDTFATSNDTISFFVQTSVKTGFEFVFDKKPDDKVYQKQFDTAKFSEIWERPEWFSNNFFVRNLQSRGKFDSVIFKNIHDNGWQASQVTPLFGDIPAGTVIAVWGDENNQAYAKELGNKGTFSKEDKRIFYSLKQAEQEVQQGLIAKAKAKIADMVQRFAKTKAYDFVDLLEVSQDEVHQAKQHGLDIAGYKHLIDTNAVKHIKREHGNETTERNRGQIAIKANDFNYIPEITANPDERIYGGKTNDGLDTIVSIKRLADNSTVIVEEVRTGRHKLAVKTMYKHTATTDMSSIIKNIEHSQSNAQSDSGRVVTDNIAKTTPTVQELKTSLKALKATAGQGVFDSVATMIKAENAFDTMHEDTPKSLKYSIGKSAQQASIAFGRELGTIAKQTYSNVKSTVQKVRKNKEYPSGWRVYLGNKWQDSLNVQLQFLGRRHIVDIFDKVFKGRLKNYSDLVADMDAMKNSLSQKHDDLVRDWGKLPTAENDKLVDLMHRATLAKYDPDTKDGQVNYKANWNNKVVKNIDEIKALHRDFNRLSPDAKKIYRQVRDNYKSHYKRVQVAMQERILRLTDGMDNTQRKAIVEKMNNHFADGLSGVYFPLQRFGDYVVVVKDKAGKTVSVGREETRDKADELRRQYMKDFSAANGYKVLPVQLSKDYVQSRDGAGRAFVQSLIGEFANRPDSLDGDQFDEVSDIVEQMWLASMPDLSWAKHGIHRKGMAGYSEKARRAYAHNMIHGTNYLARLTYSDQLQTALDDMQKFIDDNAQNQDFNQVVAQRVQNEMEKRHENLMRPNTHPLATKLTGLGFVWYLGLSPASALVNLTQTWLVGLPVIAARYQGKNLLKDSATLFNVMGELLKASKQTATGFKKDGFTFDISGNLNADEKAAFDRAVADGTIDTSQAYDLAGIADGHEDAAYFKYQRFMRGVAKMFHEAEVFNRQATFIACYRLAKQNGMNSEQAFQDAKELTYKSHFDYATSNRARILQGNWQRVIFLFKQFGFNMLYTVYRNLYVGLMSQYTNKNGFTAEDRKQARRALLSMGVAHFTVAGVLGLPLVGTLLSVISGIAHAGGADDDWDAEEEMKKAFAAVLGKKGGNAMSYGLTRYLGVDLHGRLGLNSLIFPDVQENLEGQDWAERFTVGMSGAVVGMGVNFAKGLNQVHNGEVLKGAESMLPTAVRNGIKSYRLATQGQVDRTGVVVKDDFNAAEIATTAIGFNPASLRRAMEAKSAILNTENRKNKARTALMSAYAKARMDGDKKAMQKVLQEINEWNRKNPTRRIEPKNLQASLKNRQRRITNAKHGVYLSDNHQDAYNEVDYAIVD